VSIRIIPQTLGFEPGYFPLKDDLVNLAQLAETGHFTKVFDPNRTISQADFDVLTKFLYSIPQSVNAQSTRYIVAADRQARSRIAGALGAAAAINGPKVMNASHVIVCATRQNLTNEYLDELHAQELADGKFPNEEIANQWKSLVRGWIDMHRYDAKDLNHWMEKQTYLAVGMMLMAAEELGINAIPLEGFDSRLMDAELGLRNEGFTSTLLLVLGYRAESDFYLKTPKSRLPMERHVKFL
jgi:nitroreductase / dihydropteridine reductase